MMSGRAADFLLALYLQVAAHKVLWLRHLPNTVTPQKRTLLDEISKAIQQCSTDIVGELFNGGVAIHYAGEIVTSTIIDIIWAGHSPENTIGFKELLLKNVLDKVAYYNKWAIQFADESLLRDRENGTSDLQIRDFPN